MLETASNPVRGTSNRSALKSASEQGTNFQTPHQSNGDVVSVSHRSSHRQPDDTSFLGHVATGASVLFLLLMLWLLPGTPRPEAAAAVAPHKAAAAPFSGILTACRKHAPAWWCRTTLHAAKGRVPIRWVGQPALAELVRRESNFDPCAVNPLKHNCGYRGRSACGLYQRYPCRAFHGGDAYQQSVDGLAYVQARYGRPVSALAHHNKAGTY